MPGQRNGKQASCRFSIPAPDLKSVLCRNKTDFPAVTPDDCESCPDYKSRYIQYPIQVNGIEIESVDLNDALRPQGSLVAIRPCGDEYGGKTFLGLYLGDLPWFISVSRDEKSGILAVNPVPNPAIYIFELRKIVRGCESWWHVVDDPSGLSEITQDDIENTWYVRLMKEIGGG